VTVELSRGEKLGHYQLLSRIGRGGMASVWVARPTLGSAARGLVAVKVMLAEFAQLEDFRRMFLEEGTLVSSIDHPNVVGVHEVAEARGVLFMAMEWVEGASLHTLIREAKRRRAVPAEMAVRMIADTAAGLHAAHELLGPDGVPRGIVHCDVSPHNILIGLNGAAKLVDFGVARATVQTRLGGQENVKGKIAYMSPEQAHARPLDRRSDVFSLGVVLFELTTGERLFRGENPAHTLRLVQQCSVPRPRDLYPQYPPELEAIVLRALEPELERRYQSADELRLALERYLVEARIMVPRAGVAGLMTRVVGTRIETQRASIREALSNVDQASANDLVPDTPVGVGPVSSPTYASGSSTPGPHVVARRSPSRASVLFGLTGALSAVASLAWVTLRPLDPSLSDVAPATTDAEPATPVPAVSGAVVDDEHGVSVEALPVTPSQQKAAKPAQKASRGRKGKALSVELEEDGEASDEPATMAVAPGSDENEPAESEPKGVVAETVKLQETPTQKLPPMTERPPLNRSAAITALSSASMQTASCRSSSGPAGRGQATVTFSPDGHVQGVSVSAPFSGTAVGSCVTRAFRGARVPPYQGSPVTLSRGFNVPD